MNLLQIYPRLCPAIDGIGDYALKLAHGLSSRYGMTTHFLTNCMAGPPRAAIAGFPVTEMTANTPEALLNAIPPNTDSILSPYSDYPYDLKYPYQLFRCGPPVSPFPLRDLSGDR